MAPQSVFYLLSDCLYIKPFQTLLFCFNRLFCSALNNIKPVVDFVKGIYTVDFKGKIIKMKFPQFLEYKFLEWQQREGGRKTVRQFAAYIGVSAASISTWWNENRTPEGDNVRKLADKLGIEVYDALGIPRPDEDLLYITQNWQNYTEEEKQQLRGMAAALREKNAEHEIRTAHLTRKPKPSS